MTRSSSNLPASPQQQGRAVLPILPPEERPGFKWKPGLKAVLDIGSTKTTCLIGQGLSNGGLRILSWGWRRTEGVNSGAIVDTAQLERVIRATVGDAEKKISRRISDVVVNLSCGNPQSYHVDTDMSLGGREVLPRDVRYLHEEARHNASYNGYDLVHTMPLGFNVDETMAVLDPCGHQCNNLIGKFHVIGAHTSALRTLSTVLHRAELRLSDVVSSPIASGIAVLDHDERELGVTVVDMGAGTTSLAVFAHGRVLYTSQLRVGGHHITRDIALSLSIPTDTAERLKTLHGVACASADDAVYRIPLPLSHNRGVRHITRAELVRAIAPRIEETLEMVRHELDVAGLGRPAEGRVVLTGGGALLTGLGPLAASIFNRPVRLGHPYNIHGLPEAPPISAGFSTASGLLAWAVGARDSFCLPTQDEQSQGFAKRVVNFIRRTV